jgi:DNA-binding phage protein
VRAVLGQQTVGVAQIAKETGLTQQTVYRIKGDPGVLKLRGFLGFVDTSEVLFSEKGATSIRIAQIVHATIPTAATP